ncbi:hypothetical protein ABTG31_20260, partial [Acinetobacter baumannii]
ATIQKAFIEIVVEVTEILSKNESYYDRNGLWFFWVFVECELLLMYGASKGYDSESFDRNRPRSN